MSKTSNKIVEGLSDAAAFARIQKLIDAEKRRIRRDWKRDPGSASPSTSEFLRGLEAAQRLFGTTSASQ